MTFRVVKLEWDKEFIWPHVPEKLDVDPKPNPSNAGTFTLIPPNIIPSKSHRNKATSDPAVSATGMTKSVQRRR